VITKPSNIFISWSGPRSKHVASALRLWLPDVLQSARPWMSDSDIDKGSRGLEEISKALDTIEVGVTCLTPENLTAPWILFEGGALSKRIGEKARLCTYLLGGLKHGDVPQPLGMFQHTVANNKEETRKMLDSINRALNPDGPVSLDRLFEAMWPHLEKEIGGMPEKSVPAERPLRDMVAEILDIVRTDANPKRGVPLAVLAGSPKSPFEKLIWDSFMFSQLFSKTPVVIPEEAWEEKSPACPHCGSLNVAVRADGFKTCQSCGATNGAGNIG
jgi:hypothetical protein